MLKMWKSLSIASANTLIVMNKASLINVKALPTIGFKTFQQQPYLMREIRYTSSLPDMKTPLNEAKQAEAAVKQASSQQSQNKKGSKSHMFRLLGFFASGAIAYFAISFYLDHRSVNKTSGAINYSSPNIPGRIQPSKSFTRQKNPGNIKITLYQYVTCPFCCKVRAYLDYFGYTYDIVEVNSINKKQIDWSDYKKVPIVAIRVPASSNEPDKYDESLIQLNDSTVIISTLETFRLDPSHSLKEIGRYYEPYDLSEDKSKRDYTNKYFVMLYNSSLNDGQTIKDRKGEREWREWVDKKFIHAISPNVYRTLNESFEAFEWFSKAGDWKSQFNTFESLSVYYIGSLVMYIIGKRLKSRHQLKDDVRQSLYDYCNEWVDSLKDDTFRGGATPNLADLALYGSIGSFEGCIAFDDMMKNSKIKNWYEAMKDQVQNSQGSLYLNTRLPPARNSNDLKSTANKPAKKRFYIF